MAARPPLSLKARALQWLAQREHSRVELRRKLCTAARRHAAGNADRADDAEAPDPAPEIETLLDWLVAERHLSQARFVESRVHARSQRFGNQRIARELAQHGASLDDGTRQQLRDSEFERARAVCHRKYGVVPAAETAERARRMRFLAGRGFSADVIRRVVRGDEPA